VRFLADESCDFAVVRVLRAAGHNVLAVSEFMQRSVDKELMEMAHKDQRILLTEDKDFGWLAFVAQRRERWRCIDSISGGYEADIGNICQAAHHSACR
jgi:predicted nuclease of predicted toxin-antitoxin system